MSDEDLINHLRDQLAEKARDQLVYEGELIRRADALMAEVTRLRARLEETQGKLTVSSLLEKTSRESLEGVLVKNKSLVVRAEQAHVQIDALRAEVTSLRAELADVRASAESREEAWTDSLRIVRASKEAALAERTRERDALREALEAARDAMAAFQKQAGWLPQQQGYSATMTEPEMELARAVAAIDAILSSPSPASPQQDEADHDCIDWNSGGACAICRRTLSIQEQQEPKP